MSSSPQPGWLAAPLRLELFARSGAQTYGLSEAEFGDILERVAAKYLPANASREEAAAFCQPLHLEELALCSACAAGHERAWEAFLTRYRARLYEIAGSIAGQEGRELADSVYADLYGLKMRGEQRVSKLSYYTGRGSLEGWLRAILAQSFVDRYRTQKRLVSLEEKEEAGEQFLAPPTLVPPGRIRDCRERRTNVWRLCRQKTAWCWRRISWTGIPWPRWRACLRSTSPPSAVASTS